MRTLVLGGTGQIGNAVVRRLLENEHEVTVVSRRAERPVNLAGLDIRYVVGNLDDFHCFGDWLSDQDAVIDAAAPYALNLFSAQGEAERDPLGYARRRTLALIAAAAECDVSLVYVGTLTTGRSKIPAGPVLLQRQLARRVQPYFSMKALIETLLLEAAGEGLPVIMLHPVACLGPWEVKPRNQCWIPAVVESRFPLVPEHKVNVVDTRDLADVLVLALRQRRYGESIPVTGHNTTVRELFSLVCAITGTRVPRWSAPAELGVIPSMWAEFAWAFVGRPSPLPSLIPTLLSEQDWMPEGQTARELGKRLRPLKQTISETIDWYREIGYL